jgi:hypothetical protein
MSSCSRSAIALKRRASARSSGGPEPVEARASKSPAAVRAGATFELFFDDSRDHSRVALEIGDQVVTFVASKRDAERDLEDREDEDGERHVAQ